MWCVEGVGFGRMDFENYQDAEKVYQQAKNEGKNVVLRPWDIEDSIDLCSTYAQKKGLTDEEWEENPCFI